MQFQKGQSGNPAGRKKGIPTKVTAAVKDDVIWVYQKQGGKEGLNRWVLDSKRNRAAFYQWVINKLLPSVTSVVGEEKGKEEFKPLNVIINANGDGGPKGNNEPGNSTE